MRREILESRNELDHIKPSYDALKMQEDQMTKGYDCPPWIRINLAICLQISDAFFLLMRSYIMDFVIFSSLQHSE